MKSLFTLVLGLVVDAANRCIELDPDYKPQAIDLCERFYKTRNASESSTSVKCVGNGAESIVYRCQTAENMDPPQVGLHTSNTRSKQLEYYDASLNRYFQVALKIYFHSGSKNFTELSLIDMQLYEQGIRYPVYEWFDDIGKAELFFEGLKDEPDFSMPAVRTQMAKVLAKLHSGHVNGINKVKYRSTKSDGWWNTYEVENHFEQIWWLMKHASDKFPGSPELIYETVKMNKRDFWTEVKLVEKILQSYYTENPETAVICHNDPHMKNIMVNKEGDFDPASLMLIDYDQAGYGFRAFDLLYNIFNWNYLPNDDDELTFINGTVWVVSVLLFLISFQLKIMLPSSILSTIQQTWRLR